MSVQNRVKNTENNATRRKMEDLCGICTSPGSRQHSLNNKSESLAKFLELYYKLHKKTANNNALKKRARNAYNRAWLKSVGIVQLVTAPPRQRGMVFGQIQNKENNTKRKQMEMKRDICVTPGNRYTTEQKANALAQYIHLYNALHTKTPANKQEKKALEKQSRRPNAGRPSSSAPAGRPSSSAPAGRPRSAPAGRPRSAVRRRTSIVNVVKRVATLLPLIAGGPPIVPGFVPQPQTRVQTPNQQCYHHGTRTEM